MSHATLPHVQRARSSNAPSFRLAAGVSRGRGHRLTGQPGQDAVAYGVGAPGTVVVALADGAGSRPRSHAGAALAVSTTTMALLRATHDTLVPDQTWSPRTWKALVNTLVGDVRAALHDLAAREERPVGDYASTLLAFVATPHHVAALQIGDGHAVLQPTPNDPYTLLTKPQRGAYANVTTFVTSPGALDEVSTAVWNGPVQTLALASDGLDHHLIDPATRTGRDAFLDPLCAFTRRTPHAKRDAALSHFLASARVQQATLDDLALVVAVAP
ncbi:MAG: PP2C family serine/threonine-protein phosphatase [Bacteroidota bacterium]